MQIGNIALGNRDSFALGPGRPAFETLSPLLDKTERQSSRPTADSDAAFREIMARYDVERITPRAFSAMLEELYRHDAISETELKELTLLRLELDAGGVEPDAELNLLDHVTRKLNELEAVARRHDEAEDSQAKLDDPLLEGARRQFAWLEKLAAIHDEIDFARLDVLA